MHRIVGPDWQSVVTQSEQPLHTQSKDLRVACWLSWGLYRCEGMNGLQAGLNPAQQSAGTLGCAASAQDQNPRRGHWLVGKSA